MIGEDSVQPAGPGVLPGQTPKFKTSKHLQHLPNAWICGSLNEMVQPNCIQGIVSGTYFQ